MKALFQIGHYASSGEGFLADVKDWYMRWSRVFGEQITQGDDRTGGIESSRYPARGSFQERVIL